ncbi:hypothetical protein TcCL_ESM04874 [Trypanosoma cruzi]|nr:hypothetical protein TcCL_ESM04874 [Trypanosoma cruzi]
MLKSDVELPASNATIPAHMSAPPEKTHKPQTAPFTSHPVIIPTHRDTPNRSSRHSMPHARQRLTRGQTSVPRISDIRVLWWEVKKRGRAARPQKSATTGRKSTERSRSNEFSPNALSLPPSPTNAPRAAKQKYRPIKSL